MANEPILGKKTQPKTKMKHTTVSVVDDVDYGLYVWVMPDGTVVGDDDGNWMNVAAKRGDTQAIDALTQAAKYYGVTIGTPCFLSGRRRISDSELEDQKERLANGLTPDPFDVGAAKDEMEYIAQYGNR